MNFEGRGGSRNSLLRRLHVICDAHFRTWPSFSSQSHVSKFGSDWLSLSRVIVVKKKKKSFREDNKNIHPIPFSI